MSRIHSSEADATVVLVTSIGSDASCWQFLGLENAKTLEYPGHGQRPRQPGWTQQDFADEIVDRFDGPLHLVGQSLGGDIVGHVLTRHPDRVRSALIACAGSIGRPPQSPETREAARQRQIERGRQALDGGMAAILDGTLERWFTPLARRGPHAGLEYARRTLGAMDPEAWNDIWLAVARSGDVSAESAARIEQPVTIVAGMHDRAVGVSGLLGLHRQIPRSRMEILTGPHMLHLERPENLLSALDRHFAWIRTGHRVEAPIASAGWPDVSIAQGVGA